MNRAETGLEAEDSLKSSQAASRGTMEDIRKFWNEYVYEDERVAQSPPGTVEFFDELEACRLERLEYLPRIVDFPSHKGKSVLEVGCRIGLDLAPFARHGAIVTGIELAESCIEKARKNFALHGLEGDFIAMDGEEMQFDDESFDLVYAHGVLQYTESPERMISEMRRVLKPGGQAILMVYNRYSWLTILSKLSGKNLEHEEAPSFKKYSVRTLREAFSAFSQVDLITERFPIRTRLHSGAKASLYYTFLVGGFNIIPKAIVRPIGSHIMVKATR